MSASERRQKLDAYLPMLMLVTDRSRLHGREIGQIVIHALEGGVNAIQVRERGADTEEVVEVAQELGDIVAGKALFIINSDVDAAIEVGAEAIHLPEGGGTITTARRVMGERALISRAAHSAAMARQAAADGADFIVLGSVFASVSHPEGELLGIDALRETCAAISAPVIGIGGITAANAGDAIRAGARGVAVIGAIFDADDARAAAAELRAAIDQAGIA
jgi:thiamine-phosphate pyrophosphorylase